MQGDSVYYKLLRSKRKDLYKGWRSVKKNPVGNEGSISVKNGTGKMGKKGFLQACALLLLLLLLSSPFVFDYIGGSEESMSDGSMSEMSVLTEAEDLSFILETFRSDSRFSADEIFLFGGSQGGFISAYAAGEHPDEIAGLVLLYPAFNLQDICRTLASDAAGIPDSAVIRQHNKLRLPDALDARTRSFAELYWEAFSGCFDGIDFNPVTFRFHDGGWDSITQMSLICRLEETLRLPYSRHRSERR